MSNKYIEVVKKWLADNDSVSREELTANAAAAGDAWYDALNAAKAADEAYEAATDAVNSAAYHDACDDVCDAACTQLHNHDAAHRVKRYEELFYVEVEKPALDFSGLERALAEQMGQTAKPTHDLPDTEWVGDTPTRDLGDEEQDLEIVSDYESKRQGIHTKTYPNGATYRGYYLNDKRHGAGVKTHADGKRVHCVYEHGVKVDSNES